MAAMQEEAWRHAQELEKTLQARLKEREQSFSDIAHSLAQYTAHVVWEDTSDCVRYRSACEDVILRDVEFAVSKGIENRLWDVHGRTNNRFRKELKYFQEAGKRKHVEQRKMEKEFLDFIKSAQRYYRGYIQRLASCYHGVRQLELVAHNMTLSTLSADEPTQVSGYLANLVLLSCHQTLVRLGDLSRWREMQLVTKDRNWGPAVGYYELARAIYPASGASHNQLAVIALADLNHLRATYHLYRALTAEEPHPSAKGNLEIEYKKIEDAWRKGELFHNDPGRDAQVPGAALVAWFMRLHARCYRGVDFPEQDELESEVLGQLAVDLKERSLDALLNKFVLVNVAAEYFAVVRLAGESFPGPMTLALTHVESATPDDIESAETRQSFYFLQRLNVKTFFTLLQILLPELEHFVSEDGQDDVPRPAMGSTRLTAVTRRVLPSLRQYSSWLTSNASVLSTQDEDSSLGVEVKEMWKIYANTLTLLASTFPVTELPSVEYLLEEDTDTLGFKPFANEHTRRRYHSADTGQQKPKNSDHGIPRHHPNVEMYARIRDFLTDGMFIQLQETTPIRFVADSMTFVYIDEGIPSDAGYQATESSVTLGQAEITHISETAIAGTARSVDGEASLPASASISMDLASKRMVDDLVDSETADEGEIRNESSLMPKSGSKEFSNETNYGLIGSSTARELLQEPQDQPQASPRPLLPSIMNSPFAPQPGEATPGTRPGTAKRTTPGHSQKNSQSGIHLQCSVNVLGVDSTAGSMPDPSDYNLYPYIDGGYHNQPYVNTSFPTATSYTSGRRASATYGNDAYCPMELSNFHSSSVDWGGSGTVQMATNIQTPPNGQDAG